MFSDRKGITPVIAIVLLIAVTVAGSATLYTTIVDTQERATESTQELNINPSSVEFESCWGTQADPNFSVRNTGPEVINASDIPVRVNGTFLEQSNGDYDITTPIVDPQETFTLDISITEDMNRESEVGLIIDGEATTHKCRNLN